MQILVYARTSRLDDLLGQVRDDHPDAKVLARNAVAHAAGQTEACDLVIVDDDFPQVADDYEAAGITARVVDTSEPAADPEPLPDPDHDPLLDLTVADLRDAIDQIHDVARLEAVLAGEDRVTAQDALTSRIDELEG